MPLGPKFVLAIQIVGLAASVFWSFTLHRVGDTIGIVIQSAVLIGLYARQTVAWVTARWLTAIGASVMSLVFVLVTMSGTTKFWILTIVASQIILTSGFFYCQGRTDSRAYFRAPRRG